MTDKTTIQRVWRETVALYGPDGINRPEAIEAATATLMVEVNAGRLQIDIDRAIRDELARADEADGRAADNIIERAAFGELPLISHDLDLVVTLGRGLRKSWRDVTPADLRLMVSIRYENYRTVRASFMKFSNSVNRLLPVVEEYGTFGAAHDAGGFPPADFASQAGAA